MAVHRRRRRSSDKEQAVESTPVPPEIQALIDAGAPIDRGWAWVVCFAAFLLHLLISGLTRASGIIFVEAMSEFGSTKGETSAIITVFVVCSVVAAPVASVLSQRASPRMVILIGGVLSSVGMALSSFTQSLLAFVLVFSGIVGCGYGFLFTPSIAVVSQFFYRRRALAVGISMSGGGVGAFVIPPLITFLIKHFTFRGALLILGAVYLNCVVSASLMRPFTFYMRHTDPALVHQLLHPPAQSQTSERRLSRGRALLRAFRRFTALPLLRNSRLYLCGFGLAVLTEGLPLSYMLIPPVGSDLGLGRGRITGALLAMGVPDIVGRVGIGWLADKELLRRWQLAGIVAGLESALWLTLSLFAGFEALLVFAVLLGALGGAAMSLIGPVMAEAVGITNINTGLGLMMALKLLMFPVPIVLGILRDVTGTWLWSLRLVAVLIMTSMLVLIMNFCIKAQPETRPVPPEETSERECIEMDPVADRIVQT